MYYVFIKTYTLDSIILEFLSSCEIITIYFLILAFFDEDNESSFKNLSVENSL
jgi:hypothetical protein